MQVIANGGATPNTGAGDSARDGAAKVNVWAGGAVLDKDLTGPPASPSTGDAYIVAATATGAWEGKEDQIALYHDNRWWFIVPGANDRPSVRVIDEDTPYRWNGTQWVAGAVDEADLPSTVPLLTDSSWLLEGALRVGSGQATGSGAWGEVGGSAGKFRLLPTDAAGGYQAGYELFFDASGDNLWTAENGFKVLGTLTLEGALPDIYFEDTGAAADNGRWRLTANGGDLQFQALTDAGAGGGARLDILRTGNNMDGLQLTSAGSPAVYIANNGDSYFDSGNVGIGTSSPAVPLDVNGAARADNYLTETFTIADDAVATMALPTTCWVVISTTNGTPRALFFAFASAIGSLSGSGFTSSTGVLTGTTGVDGEMTISMDGGTLHVENRAGASRNVSVTILAGAP